MILGGRNRLRTTFHQKDLAFEAQEFGKGPSLLLPFADSNGSVDCLQSSRDFAGAAHGKREFAEEPCVVHAEGVLGNLLKCTPEHMNGSDRVTLPAKKDTLPAMAQQVPLPPGSNEAR